MSTYCAVCHRLDLGDINPTFAICNICGNGVCDEHRYRNEYALRVLCEDCLPEKAKEAMGITVESLNYFELLIRTHMF